MYDDLKRRRLRLLYQGVRLAEQEGYAQLNGATAIAAGYQGDFGELEYMRILELDIDQLLKDKAIEADREHRMYGVGGFVPYRLTPEGRQMLLNGGYPLAL
jgi:hypothetical protein